MKIALDITPIKNNSSNHKVRGVGFYLKNLIESITKFYPQNSYIFFTQKEPLKEKVDIVHFPYFDPYFITLPLIKRNKQVVTVHDLTPVLYPSHFPSGIKGKFRWLIQKSLLKNSETIITDSKTSKKDISRLLSIDDKKIKSIYLAASDKYRKLSAGKWRLEILSKYNLPSKFVLYVGDVTWNKNIPSLVEAIKSLNITLVMVGKALAEKKFDYNNAWNADRKKINQLIKNDKRFIVLGFIDEEDLLKLYNAATLLAFPSIYEGFGLPVIEALQSGCPVVTSKYGSVKEIAGNSACFINPYNIESIASGIGEVFFNLNYQKELSENGIIQSKKFSWQKTASETIKTYENCLI